MNEDYYGEALIKLTEVVKELNMELAELKKDYKNHDHGEIDRDYISRETKRKNKIILKNETNHEYR